MRSSSALGSFTLRSQSLYFTFATIRKQRKVFRIRARKSSPRESGKYSNLNLTTFAIIFMSFKPRLMALACLLTLSLNCWGENFYFLVVLLNVLLFNQLLFISFEGISGKNSSEDDFEIPQQGRSPITFIIRAKACPGKFISISVSVIFLHASQQT